jgi:hypothetical protein
MATRVVYLESALQAWAARKLGGTADDIPLDADLRKLSPNWANLDTVYRQIEPFVCREIGFSGFYESELEKHHSIRSLAEYLAGEVDPPPLQDVTLKEEHLTFDFKWPVPKPYFGEERIEGRTLFILGSPRSGTTLFRTMLAGHERIYSPPELHLLPFDTLNERREAFEDRGCPWMRHGLCQAFANHLEMSEDHAYLYVDKLEERALPVARVYKQLHPSDPDAWLVDKSPTYLRHPVWVRRAEQMFVEPKYVYLTRHPGAVVESIVRMRFYRLGERMEPINPWLEAEQSWTITNREALDFLDEIPRERWMQVRYEDLIPDPEGVMRKVADFLGLDYRDAMADPYKGKVNREFDTLGDPGLRWRKALDPSLVDSWKKRLPPLEFGKITKQLIEKLGYEV